MEYEPIRSTVGKQLKRAFLRRRLRIIGQTVDQKYFFVKFLQDGQGAHRKINRPPAYVLVSEWNTEKDHVIAYMPVEPQSLCSHDSTQVPIVQTHSSQS